MQNKESSQPIQEAECTKLWETNKAGEPFPPLHILEEDNFSKAIQHSKTYMDMRWNYKY